MTRARHILGVCIAELFMTPSCNKPDTTHAEPAPSVRTAPSARVPEPLRPTPPAVASKIDFVEPAMGTEVHFIAYTTARLDEPAVREAMHRAHAEVVRIEGIMTSWRKDSEVGQINENAGKPVHASDETLSVIEKSLWAGNISGGVFDITFHALGDLWRFGDAAQSTPELPDAKTVAEKKKLVDYRKVKVDAAAHTVSIANGMRIDLGGIAKGYAVDRAAAVLKAAGLTDFLAQAGGDLYGAGRKPDGSPWVSGIRDPRGKEGEFFATLELTDHAFSTAGDYARAFFVGGKRYHHIIDPRTGYPATACRSVTVWAADALTADAVDDAVFILGPENGLKLVESLPDVGAVIVDKDNKVLVSQRLNGKVRIVHPPTDGP
jgi:FAD:protein FMN transferase